MQTREEAERLVALFTGKPDQLVTFLSGQLAVVKQQAHLLLGLCGLTITVTGFSGAHMIRSGTTASMALVAGITLTQIAVVLCLRALTHLRWVSRDLSDDLVDTAEVVILRRDREHRSLLIAGAFVGVGLAAYLCAVAIAAVVGGAT